MIALLLATVVSGRLCISGSECRPYSCGQTVASSETARTFTFLRSQDDTYVLGAVPAGQSSIGCDGGGATLEIRITLAKPPRRATVRAAFADADRHRWELLLDEASIGKPLRLRLAPGVYDATVESTHYQSAKRKITVVASERATVPFALQPLPILSGRVLAADTGSPLIGAQVRNAGGGLATTDASGRFSLEADPETWPRTITVFAPGFVESAINVPAARVSKALGDVVLRHGGKVVVDLQRQDAAAAVQIDLQVMQGGKLFAGPAVQSMTVAAGEATRSIAFEPVTPGAYFVLAKGAGRLERCAKPISVVDGETRRVSLSIVPLHLHVRAEMAGAPLAKAALSIRNDSGRWEEKFSADDAGEADAVLWQGGNVVLSLLRGAAVTVPYRERRELTDGRDADWTLSVPSRAIAGVVLDAITGKPIAKARVSLHMDRSDRTADAVSVTTGESGEFRFVPVEHGTHRLVAVGSSYLPSDAPYVFSPPEEVANVVIRLDPAALVSVTVLDARNAPVAGAQLIEYQGSRLIGYGLTDGSGNAQMPAGEKAAYELYVIPRDGSFAFGSLTAESPTMTIRVPEGTCRIIVRCESEAHAPLPGVWVGIGYNGRPLPANVLGAILTAQGATLKTASDGQIAIERMPPGRYEFWPNGTAAEMRGQLTRPEQAAPAKMVAAPGENIATLTLDPLQK